jgi:myo-inositol-1(or 4)-monophosphatase
VTGVGAGRPAAVPTPAELTGLIELAENTAREAAGLVLAGRPERVDVVATKSSPTDVVTAMDRAVEDLIRRRISAVRPDDAIYGEEDGHRSGRSGLTWLVDPIDGTVNYLYGIPAYAVSIAVVTGEVGRPDRWEPLAGSVVEASTGHTWTAGAGRGARRDGERITIPSPPELERALVGTGFGYLPERRRSQARVLLGLLPQIRDVRRIGSASLDLCAVADGRLDAFYERGLNPWDIAAGMVVLREAGAGVTGLRGGPASPDMLVAAAPPLQQRLVAELERLDADQDLPPGSG